MTKKIFRSILIVSLAALLACLVIVLGVLFDYLSSVQKSRLSSELDLAIIGTEQGGAAYLEAAKPSDCRLTWIAADGTVLFDSKAAAAEMENHADREEVREALTTGRGESERYSATLTEKTLYSAAKLRDGTVLRISVEHMTVISLLLGLLQPILVVLVLVLILAGVLANRMAKRIVQPLNELDLEHPLEADTYEELSHLLRRIHQLHLQVDSQLSELHRKQEEFAQITGSMNEGLVLLDEQGTIVSINPAAAKLFHADSGCVGADFLTIERSHDLNEAIHAAMENGHSESVLSREGREYQLAISRIEADGTAVGAVLLAFDVTERVFAERNRREFTANVSHELKTPLQAIMGSAELIENGLVKPEDMSRFVGHIRSEATRLVALIEDILRLSQLDEGSELPFEPVELRALVAETAAELQYAADEKAIAVSLTGEETTVFGVRKLLLETVFNLCDNAIKYNRTGGSVELSVSHDEDHAYITVRDTGIGIPPEHQARIFERFYRVDKSHSKQSGGTGLGLSIVKHAVACNHGSVSLQSTPGEGTSFTVTLPYTQG